MPKLRLKATILVFGVAMAIGIALAVAINTVSLNKVQIGGATYDEIVQVKDLVADILPPRSTSSRPISRPGWRSITSSR